MDYFHCNSCFIQPGSHSNKIFWLTNCGHSLCEDCVNTSTSICSICHKNCKHLALNSDMPDDIKSYFIDANKELKKVIKVLLVQNKHCKLFMEEYVPKLEGRFVSAKLTIEKKCVEIDSLKCTLKDKNTEINSLHKVVKKMEGEIEDIKKQFSRICLQQQSAMTLSPILPSPPNSYTSSRSPQSGVCSPNSTISMGGGSSRPNSQFKLNRESFMSPHPSNTHLFQDKKRLTAMELLFKSKESASRGSLIQNSMRTPGSNQTFNMSINTSPESSEDEKWTPFRKSPFQPKNSPMTPNKTRGRFF